MEGVVLIVTYAAIIEVGLAVAVGIGLITDQTNVHVSVLISFASAGGITDGSLAACITIYNARSSFENSDRRNFAGVEITVPPLAATYRRTNDARYVAMCPR